MVLEVKRLTFYYQKDGRRIIDNISFSMGAGEILGVIGLSGCGKSTLCMALCGIIPHSHQGFMEGDVLLFGENTRDMSIPNIASRVGIVFQDPETQLFLPVIRNELAFGPENLCFPREKILQVVERTSEMTEIKDLLSGNPNEISGGQQQITALAAVLCLNPEILILDEAASQLDGKNSDRILEIVLRLKEKGKTVIMVDHNLDRLKIADRVMALKDGRILSLEPVDKVLQNKEMLKDCYYQTAAR
ncbi:energy-coupling factor ABC transporter ATP-binding protein [Candidatus Contubernalis alkaliaceticus]|uniref:energy-coupling factor ABC transporter ATP-binding protein n=1 Tax=Candidatus Contubernalis alkaliaceticus TaxID=338645 RepID=UPI001F4C51AA|nr:ABC transporter ATP-binding protein [Candidatus Contubernalis alkalaceticus]UNC91955.1 ABC transporter ATP-binding protein [Candidatus Contubernalis alkalaceticus]